MALYIPDIRVICLFVPFVRQEVASQIALSATLSIWGNPTAECADGNTRVLSPQDNVVKSESPIRTNCQDRDVMKKQTLNHRKSRNTRQAKWTDTLEPKGMEPDYNGCEYVIGNGRTVPGLQMASKASAIICDVELGKPYALPENPGRSSVRSNEGAEGRGIGKKRMTACNELYRGSKFALTRKGADLPEVSCCMKGGKPMNVRYSITPETGERLANTRIGVNGLQTGITKAVIE